MGKILCKLLQPEHMKLLSFGLDAAGKTMVLYQLKLGMAVTIFPTNGFNVETINHNNMNITAWNIAGRDKLPPLYRLLFYRYTDGFTFSLDSTNRVRFRETVDELKRFVNEDEWRDAILVIANKQDLLNNMAVEEIHSRMEEDQIIQTQVWKAFPAFATIREGPYEALDWLKEQSRKDEVASGIRRK